MNKNIHWSSYGFRSKSETEEDDILIENDGILGNSFCEGNVIIDCVNKVLSFPNYDCNEIPFY